MNVLGTAASRPAQTPAVQSEGRERRSGGSPARASPAAPRPRGPAAGARLAQPAPRSRPYHWRRGAAAGRACCWPPLSGSRESPWTRPFWFRSLWRRALQRPPAARLGRAHRPHVPRRTEAGVRGAGCGVRGKRDGGERGTESKGPVRRESGGHSGVADRPGHPVQRASAFCAPRSASSSRSGE